MLIDIDTLYDEELASQYTTIESIKQRLEEFIPEEENPCELITLNIKARQIFHENELSTQFLFHTYNKNINFAVNAMNNGERIEYTREAIKFMLMDLNSWSD